MRTPTYFKSWMLAWPWGIRIALFIVLATGIVQFVVFGMTQNYVVSYFGAQPEDVAFALQITYCGIIAALPFQFRFVRYFETRNMLITVLLMGIVLSISCLFVTDIYVFIVLRLLTGFVVSATATPILILIFSRLPPERIQVVGFSVFFGTLLCAGVIIGILGVWVVSNMEWHNVYYYLALLQLFALAIVFIVLNPKNSVKKYPLYQLDWTSGILLLTALVSMAFALIYGSQHFWFEDLQIICAAMLSIMSFVLMLYRQSILKRPYIHLHIFKSSNFYFGIILLIFFYFVKDSINLIYAYSLTVLQWSPEELIMLACYNVLGIVLSAWIISELALLKLLTPRIAFLSGFSLMLMYHIWMFFKFSADVSFNELITPVFLQGVACGTLFVPIIRFIVSTAPMYTGFSATIMAAVARFISSTISISVFFSMQRYFNLENKQTLLRNLTDLDENYQERLLQSLHLYQSKGFSIGQAQALAIGALNKSLLVQSQLRTNMNVFMVMICMLAGLITLIILGPFLTKSYKWLIG